MTLRRPCSKRVADRRFHQTGGAGLADRLDADAGVRPDLPAELVAHEVDDALRLGRSRPHLESGIHVLGVFPEDHHVDVRRRAHRRRHAREVLDRTQTDIQVEPLPQGDVEAANAGPDRRGQRTLDADQVFAEGNLGGIRQPAPGALVGLLSRQDLQPIDAPPAAIGGGDRAVQYAHRSGPDVGAGAVAFDVRDDRLVRDLQAARAHGDLLAHQEAEYITGCQFAGCQVGCQIGCQIG